MLQRACHTNATDMQCRFTPGCDVLTTRSECRWVRQLGLLPDVRLFPLINSFLPSFVQSFMFPDINQVAHSFNLVGSHGNAWRCLCIPWRSLWIPWRCLGIPRRCLAQLLLHLHRPPRAEWPPSPQLLPAPITHVASSMFLLTTHALFGIS